MEDLLIKEPRFHGEVSDKSHKNMSRIKGKDTSIELILRKELWKKGYRYRKNYKDLPGRPDVTLTKYKIAIFCDSEFFHGKDWDQLKKKLKAGANSDYWISKIQRNIDRDAENDKKLRSMGWKIIHFWGNDIKHNLDLCIKEIEEMIVDTQIEMKSID